jgi:hypothetical protein
LVLGLLFSISGLIWFIVDVLIPDWGQPLERIGSISALFCVLAVLTFCVAFIAAAVVIRRGLHPGVCGIISLVIFGIPACLLLISQDGPMVRRAVFPLMVLALWTGLLGRVLVRNKTTSNQS